MDREAWPANAYLIAYCEWYQIGDSEGKDLP